jgi:hypothetical protein
MTYLLKVQRINTALVKPKQARILVIVNNKDSGADTVLSTTTWSFSNRYWRLKAAVKRHLYQA